MDAGDGPAAADALPPRRVRARVGGHIQISPQGGNSIHNIAYFGHMANKFVSFEACSEPFLGKFCQC